MHPYHQDTLYILDVDAARRQASRATQRHGARRGAFAALGAARVIAVGVPIDYPRLPVIVEKQRSFPSLTHRRRVYDDGGAAAVQR